MKMPTRLLPAIACAALMLQHQPVEAGGFALITQNGSGMGNAYAGAAAVSADASTVWFNPAGMLELNEPQMAVAANLISVENTFSNQGTTLNPLFTNPQTGELIEVAGVGETDPGGNSVIPNFYYVRALRDDLAFGLGVNVPFGNATDYGEEWVGRYQAIESAVQVIDINPALAYRVNERFSIGGGISLQMFEATLGSAVDSAVTCLGSLPTATCIDLGLTTPGDQTLDGIAEITGDSVAFTFNFGLLFKPQPGTKLGFAYRHAVDHTLEGDADFQFPDTVPTLIQDTTASAEANLPSSAMLSVAHEVSDKVELLADATFTGWSSLEELRIQFDSAALQENDSVNTLAYKDVWRVSAGVNYQHSDQLTLRAGVAYDQDPVPSVQLRTPRIPGNDRTWVAFGASYRVNAQIGFDVGYARLFVDQTPIANASESPGGTTLRGLFDADINLLSAQFNYKFQ